MSLCPCGSQNTYETCCSLYLEKKHIPQTPEQLMRSRYTAYSLGTIDYIIKTMKDKALLDFNELEAVQWAKRVTWIRLEVINAFMTSPELGFVEFEAHFSEQNQVHIIHELSEFHKINDRWFYVDGVHKDRLKKIPKQQQARNSLCLCGSGKKFKNCHAK